MSIPTTPQGLNISWSPAALADAAELSELFNTIAAQDQIPERLSPETMLHELEALLSPLEERTIVATDSTSAIVGYGSVFHRPAEAEEQRAYVNVFVAPGSRGRGLEDSITDWAIAAATDVLGAVQAAKKYFCAWLFKTQEEAAKRVASCGFEAVRHWWEMERDLATEMIDAAEDGFAVIPWKDEHAEPARLVYNAAFADHWGSTPMDSAAWHKLVIGSPGFRQDYSFVAAAAGEIIGYAANETYPEDWEAAGRSEAWIGGLGVVRSWRKRGVATALLARSMIAMKSDGMDAAMIGVDSASPSGAQHLYQSVGFRTRITGTTWQREVG